MTSLCNGRILISTYRMIQELKKRKYLPKSFPDNGYLPPDPDGILIFVHTSINFVLSSKHEKLLSKKESPMNFQEAIEAAKMGKKVRRSTWDADMWMSWYHKDAQGFLIHSHPYWDHQEAATDTGEFIYVTENDDPFACDWALSA